MSKEERDACEDQSHHPDAAEDGYWPKVRSLPGLYTQGKTLEEIEVNIREAVELYLSDNSSQGPEDWQANGRFLELAL